MKSRLVLYLVCWLATVSAGVSATLFSVYLPSITLAILGSNEPALKAQMGSWGGAAFLLGWALGAFALGLYADRKGRRKGLIVSILLCSVATFATAYVHTFSTLVALRFITGVGAGAILLIVAVIVAEALAQSHNRAVVLGILINAFPVGMIVSGAMQGLIPEYTLSYSIASTSILLAVAVMYVVPESSLWKARIADASRTRSAESLESATVDANVFDRAYRGDILIGVTLFGSMLVGLWAVFVWMPTWVSSLSMPEHQQSNRALTNIMLGCGAIAGGLLSGWVSNMLGRRGAAALGYACVFGVSVGMFVFMAEPSVLFFAMIFLLSTCIGFNQGVLTGYLPELFPTSVRAAATGLSFNVGRVITSITVFFVGVIATTFGRLEYAMFAFSFAYLIGLGTLAFARETRGQELPQ
ncbi:MAG: MFS transporter [bacterium]|nr:MFS transporter [bacterium]